ncbi:MAG: hypothetical protein M1827_003429 [Pycnora praestabilis]|nr:MAG: hypothetical protein M1827_003429 [Pycnora praestabilis]
MAASSGNSEMLELMIKTYPDHTQMIEPLLERELSKKALTTEDETPLHLLVKKGHYTAAEILLRSKGPCVRPKDKLKEEPIHYAIRNGNTSLVNLLFSNGANKSAEIALGWQPLHIAIAYGHLSLVEQLLALGSDIAVRLRGNRFYAGQDTFHDRRWILG